jgi:hypothetical protein
LTHGQPTNRQYPLPDRGTKIAYKTNRSGVAERCTAPAVPKSVEVDRARLDYDDQLRRDLAWALVKTAQPPEANPLSVLQTVPGLGQMLRRGLFSARPDLARCPRVQDCVSSCRVVTGAQEAAGTRDGTSGPKRGNASRKWACSEAAVLCLRHHPAGQKSLAR